MLKKIFISILSLFVISLFLTKIHTDSFLDTKIFLIEFCVGLSILSILWLIAYIISRLKTKWKNYIGYGISVLILLKYTFLILSKSGYFNILYSDLALMFLFILSPIYTIIYTSLIDFKNNKTTTILSIILFYIFYFIFIYLYTILNLSNPF